MKNLLLTGALVLASFAVQGQNVAVVDYMKVPGNKQEAYVAVEKQWKNLHQSRVDAGVILGWELYYVRNSGSASPYNYVTVTVYENFAKTDASFTNEDFEKAFGKNYAEFLTKTEAARELIYSETYQFQTGVSSDAPDKFIVVNSICTDNVDNYVNLEKVGYLPMHAEAKKAGLRNSWGIWTRWPNSDNAVQAVAVDGYSKFSDINNTNYNDLMDKVMAGKKPDEVFNMVAQVNKTESTRKIVKSEIWETLDVTTPKK